MVIFVSFVSRICAMRIDNTHFSGIRVWSCFLTYNSTGIREWWKANRLRWRQHKEELEEIDKTIANLEERQMLMTMMQAEKGVATSSDSGIL